MLRGAKEFQGDAICARDGDLGKVRTLYFDEEEWRIYSMVVETGAWFAGRHLLIPSDVLGDLDQEHQRLTVELTQEDIRNSPEAPKHQASFMEDSRVIQRYSGCNVYWSSDPCVLQSVASPPASIPIPAAPLTGAALTGAALELADRQSRGAPLHSTRDLMGYAIQATDGEIGHVEDVVIDTATWHIRYLVVDTQNGWPTKKILISPRWIHQVHWDTLQVAVELRRDRIKKSPEFDASAPPDRDYEVRLFDHYGRPSYWSEERTT
jgi:sporulation protein YlmC with PRC-barrel domain